MMSLLLSILSILVIAEFVVGNFANVFIALVNGIDWVKGKKLSCTDGILTALAVSRIGFLGSALLNWYATVYNLAFYSPEVRIIVHVIWVVSNHCSLWFVVSLSILYLLKIANFSNLFFLHLKWKAKRVVLIVLLGSLVFLVCHLSVVMLDVKMVMNDNEGNITWVTNLRHIAHLANMTVSTTVYIIPFAMSLMALLLLLFSMWKHLKKMQLSGNGSQDISMKVHVRAMQTVISFLSLFIVFFLAEITTIWNSNSWKINSVHTVFQVVGLLYSSCHSLILIWGNKKLRQAILLLLSQLWCWLKERE
ncbi:taste receptor type 2 member 50-like [Phyllostomus discolor]|uniref:Taste receptor type 2 n=1 Tax=Phyllostomus discolor TaxID=89673 RepID=A0A6J2N691_9CHIR|nr:taste receptor type 2 member 50-like [Phyllostomus discolor]